MFAVGIASFAVALVVLAVLMSKFGRFALDRPNERSLHKQPVPRTGGLGVLAGALISIGFGGAALWLPITLVVILAAVSFTDDLRGLSTIVRLAAHLAAAGILVWCVLTPMHPLELALLALAVAWTTNLYNFMDGSDGLAGGMALFGFGTYAIAASVSGHAPLLALDVALAAAACAFLLFNFPPARIFLGDVGSVPLGFLAASLGLQGWRDNVWPLWFPLLVFAPFVADATVTLIKRLLKGDKVWQAHRDHYYQRLVRMGVGHRRTALTWYALMLACALAALYARGERPAIQAAAFGAATLVLVVVGGCIDVRWAHHNRSKAPA